MASLLLAIQDGVALQCDMDFDHVSAARMSRLTHRVLLRYLETGKPAGRCKRAGRIGRQSKRSAELSAT